MLTLLSHPVVRRATVIGASMVAVGALVPQASAAPVPVTAVRGASVAPAATAAATSVHLTATRVVSGFSSPLLVRSANDGTSRLFVVEQAGRVRTVLNGRITGTFLDIRSSVTSGGERGLLGLAFAPDFARSHLLWVTFTRRDGALVLARLATVSATSATVARGSLRTVLVVPHPTYANHNGGDIAFGRDGYLYLGTGDGGSGGDPRGNAQNLRSLLGKMLRVNVRCAGHLYCIPPSNPYATSKVNRHEIWMSGLRNPWRWSFDTTGVQYIGDVGQDRFEEVDAVLPTRARGADLGWSCREGFHSFATSHCVRGRGLTSPVFELCHPDHIAGCTSARAGEAIIGGYVYRGSRTPAALRTYVFGDYVTGHIWGYRSGVLGAPTALAGVAGFGTDDNREIYAVTLGGGLYRIGFTVR
jgi:hypothetical protein